MKVGRFNWPLEPQARERLAVRVLAFLLGSVPLLLTWGPDSATLDALEGEVAELHSRLQPGMPVATRQAHAPEVLALDWPHPDEPTAAWTWLQLGAQAHGLQVQALQPQPVVTVGDLPEQPARWRLQGPWHQWLALEAALDASAPWWLVDQWQVVPDGQVAGDVRIELQGRLGLQPHSVPATLSTQRDWPVWQHTRAADPRGAEVFAVPQGARLSAAAPAAATAANPPTEPLPADPRLWPLRELRLMGVWWQGGTAHAVLGQGLLQVTVAPGQRIGREAYLVQRVSESGVELAPARKGERATVLELTWSGER